MRRKIMRYGMLTVLSAIVLYGSAIGLRELGWTGYVEILIFIGVLLAALFYLWRLGALDFGPTGRKGGAVGTHAIRS